MESGTVDILSDKNEGGVTPVTVESNREVDVKDVPRQTTDTIEKETKHNKEGIQSRLNLTRATSFGYMGTTGDVNMEASITSDDVVRAGGFGARDDIGSFLPVAMDSTDFEASLRNARDYEQPQGQTNRPGLGWTGALESEER